MDFERARTLQVTGEATLRWDQDDTMDETGGTRRYWDLFVDEWQEAALPHALTWETLRA